MSNKATKKPITIEYLIWDGGNHREMYEFLGGDPDGPVHADGRNFHIDHGRIAGGLIITTLEGDHLASIGDAIIKGIAGEFYPCKPDIFYATYDIEQ